MSNLEKHKKNPIQEWLEEDEGFVPAHFGGSQIGDPTRKLKTISGRFRGIQPDQAPTKPELALARDPAPVKLEEKHSQAASREHLRKVNRLRPLRAAFGRASAPQRIQ